MPPEKISTRDAILQATMAELNNAGAETFTPLTICKELGIKPNLVNYHFGSREGLIREAAVTSYEEYGRGFVKVWEQFGHAPREHFAAAIKFQIEWTVSHSSIMHLVTDGKVEDFTPEQRERITKSLLQNVSLLTTAVGGVVDAQLWLARHGHGLGGGGFGDWYSLGRGDPGSTRGHGFDHGWLAKAQPDDCP